MSASEVRVTLHELSTVYSTEDLFDFLEIILVNRYNRRIVQKHEEKQ